ncbi:hypothetical protein O9992_30720 [Vibrio lentus]|nr:hypothetical protein [Vibrio lentus]
MRQVLSGTAVPTLSRRWPLTPDPLFSMALSIFARCSSATRWASPLIVDLVLSNGQVRRVLHGYILVD